MQLVRVLKLIKIKYSFLKNVTEQSFSESEGLRFRGDGSVRDARADVVAAGLNCALQTNTSYSSRNNERRRDRRKMQIAARIFNKTVPRPITYRNIESGSISVGDNVRPLRLALVIGKDVGVVQLSKLTKKSEHSAGSKTAPFSVDLG